MRPLTLVRIAFILNVVVTLSVMALAYRIAARSEDTGQRVIKSHQTLEAAEEMLRLVTDAETGTRGYLLTHDRADLDPFERAKIAIPDQLRQLDTLAHDTAPVRTKRLPDDVQQALATMSAMVAAADEGGADSAANREVNRAQLDGVRQTILSIRRDEFSELNVAIDEDETASRFVEWLAIGGAGLAMCLLTALLMALVVVIRPGVWKGRG